MNGPIGLIFFNAPLSPRTAALVAAMQNPAPLNGEALRHFSKALSKVLRHDLGHQWADTSFVLNRIRPSGRHGTLTVANLPEVLMGNRRFESRDLNGVPQLRAVP